MCRTLSVEWISRLLLFLGIVRLYTRVTYVKVFIHLSKWGGGGGIH